MHWMLMPFRRYAQFHGRSRRKEYWMFALLNVIISAIIVLLGLWGAESGLFSSEDEVGLYFGCTLGLYTLVAFLPGLAVVIRRLHDTDRSGWNILWGLVPIVGGVILLVFYVTAGTQGPNRFGPDPLAQEAGGSALA